MHRLALVVALFAPTVLPADYSLCFLTNGPQAGALPKAEAVELQKQHMAHINRMWEAGALESAGPVAKLPGVRGVFVFKVPIPEAQRWAAKDPKVVAGDLAVECHVWQAPPGIGVDYRARYGKPGFKEEMKQHQAAFSSDPVPGSLVAGSLQHPKWKYFQVLSPGVAPSGEHQIFTWFHDAQVWPSVPAK